MTQMTRSFFVTLWIESDDPSLIPRKQRESVDGEWITAEDQIRAQVKQALDFKLVAFASVPAIIVHEA